MKLIEKFAKENPSLIKNMKFIQLILRNTFFGQSAEESEIIENLNSKISKEMKKKVELIEINDNEIVEIMAHISLSKLFIKSSFQNSISIETLQSLFFLPGICLVNNLVLSSKSFNLIFNFSPMNYIEFSDNLKKILNFPSESLWILKQEDLTLMKKKSTLDWLEDNFQDLKKITSKNNESIIIRNELNSTIKLCHNPKIIKKLNNEDFLKVFQNSFNCLFVLSFEGVLTPNYKNTFEMENPEFLKKIIKPSKQVLKYLKVIADIASFYIISEKNLEYFESWCSGIGDIGLAAEYGFIIHFYSFLFIFIHFYSFLFIFIHFYSFLFILFIFIHFYSFLFIFIHFYSFLFIFIHFYSFLFIFIHFYSFLFILFIFIHFYSFLLFFFNS